MSRSSPTEREFLLGLQYQSLKYFLENQTADGLVLDRQANFGSPRLPTHGWCSTSATGMGLIALALSSAEPYRLLTPGEAITRVRSSLETALERLPCDHGMMPHFHEAGTNEPQGIDAFSTVDSSWLIAGALWASAFLGDPHLESLSSRLYDRVDWSYWAVQDGPGRGLLSHGKGRDGNFLGGCWDRLNGESIFMYVLGTGAAEERALPTACWSALRPFYGTVAGLRFNNADLGLFAFEYGLDLLDLAHWLPPAGVNLDAEARLGVRANYLFCKEKAKDFATYRHFWGLSDGDGPGSEPGTDAYRAYGPGLPVDGTAHLKATAAAIGSLPGEVLDNLARADRYPGLTLRGRYGLANVNLDRHWVGGDVVGIDAGATMLAMDNYLMDDRVREVFHGLPWVTRGLKRAGFIPRGEVDKAAAG